MHSVTILLSTYNGEKYLKEQIDSLLKQINVNLNILVRDDGSTDTTKSLLKNYQNQGSLTWYTGPNLRPAKSFINLIMNAPDSEYYAFCDQDDVWNEDKLERAVDILEKYSDKETPHLYCANYQLVDAELKDLPANGHVSTTTFEAAIVSSCCTGCTVVFNKALLDTLRLGEPETIVMHDDWCHKVCLAVGGTVDYDPTKVLKYRQHGGNADGGVHSFLHKIKCIIKRIIEKDCTRSKQLENLYKIYFNSMVDINKDLISKILRCQKANCIMRFFYLFSCGFSSGKLKRDLGFYAAVLFGYF